jgi:hypothetical protein
MRTAPEENTKHIRSRSRHIGYSPHCKQGTLLCHSLCGDPVMVLCIEPFLISFPIFHQYFRRSHACRLGCSGQCCHRRRQFPDVSGRGRVSHVDAKPVIVHPPRRLLFLRGHAVGGY